nr:glycoside hydrolase family 43 protein [uncultured Prevotella sp.]
MKKTLLLLMLMMSLLTAHAQAPMKGGEWKDSAGKHINAHGGNIIRYKGIYYWYGESRSADGKPYSSLGVSCYTSKDLTNWTNRGLVLPVSNEADSDIEGGCIIERPKVLYNKQTRKFVMWFHLELKGRGYGAARAAVAVSDTPLGPFRFVRSGRVNAGIYPIGFSKTDTTDLRQRLHEPEYKAWWTPAWYKQIERGMFFMRDLEGGQMSRDMTIFVDDDSKAYHIYSSEDNLTLHIAQLTDDYIQHNGTFVRVAAGGQNEAPTIFKKDDIYWMITSGCTGWAPNAARMFRAKNIFGPWEQLPNPCRGDGAEKTFGAQGTYIYKIETTAARKFFDNAEYVFMADIWNPKQLSDSRHLWLPIRFEEGKPVIQK